MITVNASLFIIFPNQPILAISGIALYDKIDIYSCVPSILENLTMLASYEIARNNFSAGLE
jgi:hypothetical protein